MIKNLELPSGTKIEKLWFERGVDLNCCIGTGALAEVAGVGEYSAFVYKHVNDRDCKAVARKYALTKLLKNMALEPEDRKVIWDRIFTLSPVMKRKSK